MSSIAIVGVTGTIGGRVARRLVEAGHDVVGLSRGAREVPEGVRRRVVDLTDEPAAQNALSGIQALYLTPPESGLDPLALERSVGMNVIAAAHGLPSRSWRADQAVGYQEAPDTRQAVEPYPINDVHKDLYAALFDYFKSDTYLGDPLAVTEAVDGFSYGTVEDFMRHELFAGVAV